MRWDLHQIHELIKLGYLEPRERVNGPNWCLFDHIRWGQYPWLFICCDDSTPWANKPIFGGEDLDWIEYLGQPDEANLVRQWIEQSLREVEE